MVFTKENINNQNNEEVCNQISYEINIPMWTYFLEV